MASYEDEILDQPLETEEKTAVPEPPVFRYIVTLLLFPTALLRLRTEGLTGQELVLGGLWSAAQFFGAAAIFTLLRYAYLRWVSKSDKPRNFWVDSLQSSVELIVAVGIAQLIWQQIG